MARLRVSILSFSIGVALLACEKEPANLGDCLLVKIKPGMSKDVADLVAQACALKFTEPEVPAVALTADQLKKLDGRAGLEYGSSYRVTLYNALDDIQVTEVEVYVATTIGGSLSEKTYRESVTIAPKATGTFSFTIVKGDDSAKYIWGINAAKGRPRTR